MGTNLFAITNSSFKNINSQTYWDNKLDEFKALNIPAAHYINAKNETVAEEGEWSYEIEKIYYTRKKGIKYFNSDECQFADLKPGNEYKVNFGGPYMCYPDFLPNVGVVFTCYRYSLIYESPTIDWFNQFREELYKIITVMGGTEVIFVADNACDKLHYYLERASINTSYHEIKRQMIEEMGNPITDYKLLDYEKLDYRNINEFVLDDFADLKNA